MAVILLGGGPRLSLPTEIAGLTGWWKSDTGTYASDETTPVTTDGTEVYQWRDQSGSSRHLVDVGGWGRPSLETNEVNGYPVLRFVAASTEGMQAFGYTTDTFFNNNAKTMIIAAKGGAATPNGLIWCDDHVALDNNVAVGADANGIFSRNYDGSSDSIEKTPITPTNAMIITYLHSAGTLYCGVNDTRTASMASGASGNTSVMTQVPTVGRDRGTWGDWDVLEIAFFDAAVSEEDRQAVERLMAGKYGITLGY